MRPRVCPTCTAVLGVETRHAVRRLCSQVQTERRREADPRRRRYQAQWKRERYTEERAG